MPSGTSRPSASRIAGLVIRWPTLRTSISERPGSVFGAPLPCLHYEQHHVDACQAGHGGFVEHAVERAALTGMQTRGIHQRDLQARLGEHADNPMTRGLRLGRDDTDLLADQRIDQRRFADVGAADQGDHATARGGSVVHR